MTFTYDSAAAAATATVLHNIRLEIGDTDSDAALFTDEEIGVYATARGLTVSAVSSRAGAELLACADLLDSLAARFARAYDFETDGQRFDRGQMSEMYRDRARELRLRAAGLGTVVPTRVDGYSQDVAADDVDESGVNPRRRYYADPDRIP